MGEKLLKTVPTTAKMESGNHEKKLKNILDFGPQDSGNDTNDRIKKLVQKLQEINRRIDRLASHF